MRHLMLFAVASLALASTACSTYQIRSAENHGTMPVMKLETIRTTYVLFWTEVEHQFWMCQDTGDDLLRERSCGGRQDLQCPTSTYRDGPITTNTR